MLPRSCGGREQMGKPCMPGFLHHHPPCTGGQMNLCPVHHRVESIPGPYPLNGDLRPPPSHDHLHCLQTPLHVPLGVQLAQLRTTDWEMNFSL